MSEIRKIQHRADASLSDRRKLRAMTPKERQTNILDEMQARLIRLESRGGQ